MYFFELVCYLFGMKSRSVIISVKKKGEAAKGFDDCKGAFKISKRKVLIFRNLKLYEDTLETK